MSKLGNVIKGIVLSSSIIILALVVLIFYCDLSILVSVPRQSNLFSHTTKQIISIASAAVSMRNYSSFAAPKMQTESVEHSLPPPPLTSPLTPEQPTRINSTLSEPERGETESIKNTTTANSFPQKSTSESTPPKEDNHTSINSNNQTARESDPSIVQQPPSNFDKRIREFITKDSCKSHFFFTRILPAPLFRKRDMMAVESLFKTNPSACLVILSDVMDSQAGQDILKPITNKGYSILTIAPDFPTLFNNTPALHWYSSLKSGKIKTGTISISQNLSNLLRLVALFKYGGVYLDTDFIVLKSFSDLRNTVGTEVIGANGEAKLNNAALVFDEGHPLVRRFLEDFVAKFNGNIWGNQGPHLVTRVIQRVKSENGGMWLEGKNFSVLPTAAFYPVYWKKAVELFRKPEGAEQTKRVVAQTAKINEGSYGLHFWNAMTKHMKIPEGSVISRLYSGHCIICTDFQDLN